MSDIVERLVAQRFEAHPKLAGWIEKLANRRIEGFSLGSWCAFLAEINGALESEAAQAIRDRDAELSRLRGIVEEASRYAALGRACESNGLGRYDEDGTMLFQAPADVIEEQAIERPTPENGPALWDQVLAAFPSGAIVAGGAVRDYLLGVPTRDIDVFMSATGYPATMAGFHSLGGDRDEEYLAMPTIAIVKRGVVGGVQVDAVGVHIADLDCFDDGYTPERVIETFDFAIARCWYDGERIHDTDEARADREAKTVTLLIDDRPERVSKRFARFNDRMGGGWTLVSARKDASSQTHPAPGEQ